MLTRSRFAAYDSNVEKLQNALAAVGFDPGTIDGLWGDNTRSAALAFRSWYGLPPAAGMSYGEVADNAMLGALFEVVASEGISLPEVTGRRPGGAGVGVTPSAPRELPLVSTDRVSLPTAIGDDSTGLLLALAAVGLGAVIVFGKKSRR